MSFGVLNSLAEALSFCLYPKMNSECNPNLRAVLDENVMEVPAAQVVGSSEQELNSAAEEHLARLKAEAEAQDKATRLRVAQEQLAEYAQQKEKDASAVLKQAEALEDCIQRLFQALEGKPSELQTVEAAVAQLKVQLSDAAVEAKAFAAQSTADIERAKRSLYQADIHADADGDVEMKRLREGDSNSSTPDDGRDDGEGANGQVDGTRGAVMEDATSNESEQAADPAVERAVPASSSRSFIERAKYIPVRLSLEDRRLLRLLEAALNVSEYTDKVDILTFKSKTGRVTTQIKDICAILSGLVVAQDYKKGQQLIADKNFKDNAEFFQKVFEIGRRYKIMNPDKMRSEYGKLMYMLMDSGDKTVQDLLEFNCVRPLKTVYVFLEERNGLKLLEDPLMTTATAEIIAGERHRYDVQQDIKTKERARETLAKRYQTSNLSQEEILLCIYSISDNNSYLLFNRDRIDHMITFFKQYFKPDVHEPGCSLAIQGGRAGARLTHNHERQYHYVLQSLMLWREISTEMFKLWYLAEQDMLRDGGNYRLCDTGQGLNRVQPAPALSRAMHGILARVQERLGNWVGSSVIHLGDHNVPNSLMFIDKYTQVPRILNPVVLVLEELPRLYTDKNLKAYIDNTFGSLEHCKKTIMVDFCRHAFDGSGADNFFDAGSCIDGRLTSAWNWCSKLEKKSYYHIFKVAGFVGFDGDFK